MSNLSKLVVQLILSLSLITNYDFGYCQSPITAITTTTANVVTATETPVAGAGYSFSSWLASSTFTVNYASAATGDITSVNAITVTIGGMGTTLQVVPVTAIAKVQRLANTAIPDTRNFITTWNKITAGPAAAATSGTFDCVAPKVASMEAALLTNNINSGYDNTFQNTTVSPHYNNIERVDYIVPGGVTALNNLNQIGAPIFDRGVGDDFKIAAITSIDASNNPTGYGTLVSATAANFSAAGLLGANFNYTIFVSDPSVTAGQHRPSTRGAQDIRGIFISFQDMGIIANQKIYGYSLFGQDVIVPTHTLTNPATFPSNSNLASALDLINVTGIFKTALVVLPVKLISFTARVEDNTVKLNWATSFEQDILNFIIERSSDGVKWDELASVNATNNLSGSQYQFIDKTTVVSKYYYRIKTVNRDISVEYSKAVAISINKTAAIFVTYNSFSNSLLVSSNKGLNRVKVFSANGQLMQEDQVPDNNSITSEIRLKKLLPGVYLIHIGLRDGSTYTSKIIIE